MSDLEKEIKFKKYLRDEILNADYVMITFDQIMDTYFSSEMGEHLKDFVEEGWGSFGKVFVESVSDYVFRDTELTKKEFEEALSDDFLVDIIESEIGPILIEEDGSLPENVKSALTHYLTGPEYKIAWSYYLMQTLDSKNDKMFLLAGGPLVIIYNSHLQELESSKFMFYTCLARAFLWDYATNPNKSIRFLDLEENIN